MKTIISTRKATNGTAVSALEVARDETHLILTERSPGHPGDPARKETEMTVRRVMRGPWSKEDYDTGEREFDEVQIAVRVSRFHDSGRMTQTFGSVGLRGAEITELLGALGKSEPRVEVYWNQNGEKKGVRMNTMAEAEAFKLGLEYQGTATEIDLVSERT